MFSLQGQVLKGYDKQKALLVGISDETYHKVISECKVVFDVTSDAQSQPLYPAWKYEKDGQTYYYAKMFLSKARKDKYESLLSNIPAIFCVRAIPYKLNNSNSATVEGICLYYQDTIRGDTFAKKSKHPLPPCPSTQEAEQEPY
jgi:hypothetical protein